MYSLIATDLDGTLLNNKKRIPAQNKKAIQQALERGIHVCLCSGRSFESMFYFEEELGLLEEGRYGICFNGSIIYQTHDRAIISEAPLDLSVARDVVAALRPLQKHIMIYNRELLLAEEKTEWINEYLRRIRIPLNIIPSFEQYLMQLQNPVSKVIVVGDHESLVKTKEKLDLVFAGRCNVFFSANELMEITAPTATKGTALTTLAKHLGITMSEVIAIGDQCNDLDMLRMAGLGVAVANAAEEAKNAADYITVSDNEAGALWEVFEKFVIAN